MKIIVILWVLVVVFCLWGEVEIEFLGESVTISGDFELGTIESEEIESEYFDQIIINGCEDGGMPGSVMIPHFTKMLALPESGNWSVSEFSYEMEEIRLEHPLIYNGIGENEPEVESGEWYPENLIEIAEPVIMRQVRFSQVSLSAMQYNRTENKIRILKNINLELNIDRGKTANPKLGNGAESGSSFDELAVSEVTGHTGQRGEKRGSYLFICPNIITIITTLNYLVEWKRKLGYGAEIATLDETGETSAEIKDYLQNAYDTWEDRPENVILVGDVNGDITLPSWFIDGYLEPYCVTDLPYSLLEGEDYFPDILIGRFSVQNNTQLQTIVSKIINYESDPVIYNNWTRRAIMLAYVSDNGGMHAMYSQRETVMAVREKLLDFTYTEVDTFISPWQSGVTNLANMINTGYSFINYRGAGGPVYWTGSIGQMFNISNIELLTNGFMLPMVTSIVCGGGDFAYDNYATCFGETWLAAGNSQNPKGAIGFIGPSEHDTKTPFNNCNDMGIYQGITQEGIFGSAAMMLRGKMELYNNYPDCHSMDGYNDSWDSDMFYFYVYNLLGDPGLEVWTDVLRYYNVQMTESLPLGSSSYEVWLEGEDVAGHTVALTSDGELYDVAETDADGWTAVIIPSELTAFEVTVSGYGYVPVTQAVTISTEEQIIGLNSFDLGANPVSGGTTVLRLELVNLTQIEQSGLEVELMTADELVTVETGIQIIDTLGIGAMVELDYEMEFSEIWRDDEDCWLVLKINNGELGQHNIYLEIASAGLHYAGRTVMNPENSLLIGETNDVELELYNSGEANSGTFTAILANLDGKCDVTNGDCVFSNINPGETGTSSEVFGITPDSNLIAGEPADFSLMVISNGHLVYETEFILEVGEVSESIPTFSSYGYYAIESSDEGNFIVPEYDWIEIAEPEGGSGTQVMESHVTNDGFSTCIPLPFEFCYYGLFYDEITVSSNGWLAMGDEEYVFFRNRVIPSGVGPGAMIAPFWDYLRWGNIYVYHDQYEHQFIIEWYGFMDDYEHEDQIFEVILYDPVYYPTATGDGEIKFQYQEVHNVDEEENYATIGIENETQTEGLLLSFANIYPESMHQIESETAILITIKEGIIVPRLTVETEELNISLPPDTTAAYELELYNNSDQFALEYEITVSHFPSREDFDLQERDISGNSLNSLTQIYFTSHEMNIYAFMIHDPGGGEAVHGVQMDFPENVTVTLAEDIGGLHFNGQTGVGAMVTWGYGNGEDFNGPTPPTFHVYFIVDAGTTAPIPIPWQIDGDGNGNEPHSVTGTITLMPSEQNYLWVEYPNGGEELAYGVTDTVRWNSYGNIENVDVYYTQNNFVNFDIIGEDIPNTGEVEWTIPCELTETAKVRVRDAAGNQYDNSDNYFAIRGLVITYPTSGTVMEYSTMEEIRWDFTGTTPTVDLEYSISGGLLWDVLADDVPNTGIYQFQVNLPPGDNCKFRIIDQVNGLIYEMPGEFTIVDVPVNWLNISQETGIIEPEGTSSLSIELDTSEMTAGNYLAYITIHTSYNQSVSIPVYLEILNLGEDTNQIQPAAELKNNYPNPFRGDHTNRNGTVMEYNLSRSGRVKLAIYNLRGQLIRVLIDEKQGAGNYSLHWDGKNEDGLPTAAGVYFYRLEIDSKMAATKKCLLLK